MYWGILRVMYIIRIGVLEGVLRKFEGEELEQEGK
jgi:hypothetical protein